MTKAINQPVIGDLPSHSNGEDLLCASQSPFGSRQIKILSSAPVQGGISCSGWYL